MNTGAKAMTAPLKAIARLKWSLYVDCPHCKESFDMVEYDHAQDYSIANKVFTNEWGKVAGTEVTCPHCDKEFELEKMEY